ncbi:hypothetical protein GOQ29_12970 [Clostridium sp. D2Q-14]|uniref:hypothetical protein n=1 Tax=Anaeromonas gelatinilytica TaxID=2683194 RepID=UPI00193C0ECB|nr:hypothetical protein [Anaeromonas gelatinilytica]MBS4536531.1 hypothetical protein [Anaeromonas gelatinilytica]
MGNDYAEILGKIVDIIGEVESKMTSNDTKEGFEAERYLLQKIYEDLIKLVVKSEKRYIECQIDV